MVNVCALRCIEKENREKQFHKSEFRREGVKWKTTKMSWMQMLKAGMHRTFLFFVSITFYRVIGLLCSLWPRVGKQRREMLSTHVLSPENLWWHFYHQHHQLKRPNLTPCRYQLDIKTQTLSKGIMMQVGFCLTLHSKAKGCTVQTTGFTLSWRSAGARSN